MGLGGGRSATAAGAPPGGGAAPFSNAYSLEFDGSDELLIMGDLTDLNQQSSVPYGLTQISMSFWIYPNNGASANQAVFSANSNYLRGLFFQEYAPASQLYIGWGYGAHSISATLNDSQWYHVCAVYDASLSAPRGAFYLDGVSQTINDNYPATTNTAGFNTPAGDGFAVGAYRSNSYSTISHNWEGRVDEMAIWTSALTAQQAMNIAKGGESSDSKVSGDDLAVGSLASFEPEHWWRMGDGGTWDGTNWTIPDVGYGDATTSATTSNMVESSRTSGAP